MAGNDDISRRHKSGREHYKRLKIYFKKIVLILGVFS